MKHFNFGENWASFSLQINSNRIANAKSNISLLLQTTDLSEFSILDIGSGSGIHSLAMLEMGCKSLVAFDYDAQSVFTTRNVLEKSANRMKALVFQANILEEIPELSQKQFDLVYSWGVLHHTGSMLLALKNSMKFVNEDGLLAVALYRKTPFCALWRIEKRIYSGLSNELQVVVQKSYKFFFAIKLMVVQRTTLSKYKQSYSGMRGMDFSHDVHDWLGGYPYESISNREILAFMEKNGFVLVNSITHKPGLGLFGSGCNEYLFRRHSRELQINAEI